MQKLLKDQRYEAFLVLGCFVIYVVKRLFQEAHAFDEFIYHLRSLPPASRDMAGVWSGLSDYSHLMNAVMPVVAGAGLFYSGWSVFHFRFAPKFWARDYSVVTFLLFAASVIFVFSSVWAYSSLKLEYREINNIYTDTQGKMVQKVVGSLVYSNFRKLFLVTDTVALLVLLCLYEALAQGFYFVKARLKEVDNNQVIGYALEAAISVFLVIVAVAGNIPQKDYWSGPVREMTLLGITGVAVYFLQGYFYNRCLPYVYDLNSEKFRKNMLGFLVNAIAGATMVHSFQLLIWSIYNRSYFEIDFYYLFLIFGLVVLASVGVAFLRKALLKEKIFLKTEISNKSAELSSLRSQINPHFLFNALNTLYSVALKENASKTSDGIQKLGDMMRFMLQENHQDRIPLSKEIDYLNNFIEIQRMRIDESKDIKIEVNVQASDREIYLAPMLLNPFVENAFKHGLSFLSPSWIFITLTHDDHNLYFKVHNSLHCKTEEMENAESHGIGLDNVKKRLELIYPNRHKLEIQQTAQDFFVNLVLEV